MSERARRVRFVHVLSARQGPGSSVTNDCAQSGDSFPSRTLVLSVAQAFTRGTPFAPLEPRPNMANPGKARSRRSSPGVAGSAAGTPIHVLIVEDHADTRDVLDTLLRTEGYD